MAGFPRLGINVAALSCVAIVTGGCAQFETFTYMADRYAKVGPVNVNLNCRDVYEVYDRPDAQTLVVITNPFNEVLVSCLDGGQPDLASRQRKVARIFFDEKSNRPQCRITSEVALSERHREFSYTCFTPAEMSPPRARRRG